MPFFKTINRNNRFLWLYKKGKSRVSSIVVVYYSPNKLGIKRVGITASKKIGNAVKRNRARRVITEAVRQLLPFMKNSTDYVFVARGKTPFIKTDEMIKSLKKLLADGGIIETSGSINSQSL